MNNALALLFRKGVGQAKPGNTCPTVKMSKNSQ